MHLWPNTGIWLQGDVVHRAFMDTPLTLVASSRLGFWFWQYQAQKAVCAEQGHKIVESQLWPECIRAAFGNRLREARKYMLGDCCSEAARASQILCIGAIGHPANHAGRRVMHLPTGQEATYYNCPFALQQAGKVV